MFVAINKGTGSTGSAVISAGCGGGAVSGAEESAGVEAGTGVTDHHDHPCSEVTPAALTGLPQAQTNLT